MKVRGIQRVNPNPFAGQRQVNKANRITAHWKEWGPTLYRFLLDVTNDGSRYNWVEIFDKEDELRELMLKCREEYEQCNVE
jgi:hypothetical protein